MNNFYVTILLMVTTSVAVVGQSFEGVINYNNSYVSRNSQVPSEQFEKLMGTEQAYAIKGNNYKSAFNGIFTRLQIYRGDENKSYTLTGRSDTLYWEDYSTNMDKAVKYELKRNQDTILGMACDLLIVTTAKSKTQFYFNNQVSVDPALFEEHAYGNWYYMISKTSALPLKTIYESDQYIMTSIATKFEPMALGDEVFEIQDKSKVAKAFW